MFGRDREASSRSRSRGQDAAARSRPLSRHQIDCSSIPGELFQYRWDYAVEGLRRGHRGLAADARRPCIINLPATVESSTPNVFADQVEYFCRHVARRDALIVSPHTHNDRGTAVAAAELGLMAGADRVEGTLLGNGERTGNMDIVTLAMNLYSQGVDPQLDLSQPRRGDTGCIRSARACRSIRAIRGSANWCTPRFRQPPGRNPQVPAPADRRRALAGRPPADRPRDLGRDYQAIIRVNSQSGKGGVAFVLERDYGLTLPRWMQVEPRRSQRRDCG